jgi:hypothetical protein
VVDADLSKYFDVASYYPLIHEMCSNNAGCTRKLVPEAALAEWPDSDDRCRAAKVRSKRRALMSNIARIRRSVLPLRRRGMATIAWCGSALGFSAISISLFVAEDALI